MSSGNGVPVSVVIPTYERADILPRAIESVRTQSVRPAEILVVDDHSNDSTGVVVQEIDDPLIDYHRHSRNKGANAARNTGIRNASSQFVAFLDDDDRWYESKLEAQMSRFADVDPDVGLVYTGRRVVDDDTPLEEYVPCTEGDVVGDLLWRNFVPSETPVVRRECFQGVGHFDERLQSSQDWDMWLRIAKEYQFACVSEVLAESHHDASNRISTDYGRKCRGLIQIFENHCDAFLARPLCLVRHLARMSKYCGSYPFARIRDHNA